MMGRQARASIRVMRLWKPHDPGRSCLPFTIRHHVTNETDSHNDRALASGQGQPLGCGLRPPSDLRLSTQHRIINGGRPHLLTGLPTLTSQVTIYGWSTSPKGAGGVVMDL